MKKNYSLLLIAFLCAFISGYAQIYTENFAGQANKGAVGPTPVTIDLTGVTWSIDISSADLSANSDWFIVKSGVFEGRDLDGNAVWYSPSINISAYTDVYFDLDASESGTMESDDIFVTEYRINGGTWTTAATNGSLNDDFTSNTVSQTALSGNTLEIRVTMNNGAGAEIHRLDNILVDGTAASGNTITVTQANGGTISPGTSNVADNADQSFTATADSCHNFSYWNVDGADDNTETSNPYTFTNVTADHTITAVYTTNAYNITASAGTNGSISPNGITNINCGTDQTYTITADSGYAVQDVLVDGISVGAVTSYDFTNVTATHTITATFVVFTGPCASESFVNSGNSSSYNTESWTGDNGVDWTATDSRSDQDLSGDEAIMLRNGSLTNDTSIPGGCGVVTFDYARIYSGNSTLQVFINGTQHGGDIAVSDTGSTTFSTTVNASGAIDIELRNSGNRTLISNLSWTCYSATPEPEIEIQGNSTEITDGDITPDISDDTDFGSVAVTGGTNPNTFTILNTGTADLDVTSVTSNNTEFTISGITPGIITPGNDLTFVVTFDPNTVGTRTATITVASDDADEATYTFNVEGNGINSNTSDIITNAAFVYNSNIDYTVYQAATITNTGQSIDVLRFDIRDGGASNDTDALTTELTDITFNVVNINNIRSAALFNGNALVANNPVIAGNNISFSGLSYAAPDNGSASLSLRVTFLTTVTDNDQLQFTISAATANASGSIFGTADAGGATSSTTGNRNRIEVTADRLNFLQQPSTTSTNATMTPAVQVEATDVYGNSDLDWTGNISITSTGTMTGDPITQPSASSIATFNSIVHTVSGTGLTLTANATGLTSETSTTFDIILFTFNSGDFRPKYATDFSYNGDWEYFNGSAWVNVPDGNAPQNTTVGITRILIDKYVTGGGSATNNYDCDVLIMAGGTLELLENDNPPIASEFLSAGNTLEVQSTAELIIRGDIDLASTTNLIVRDGGKMTIDQPSMSNVHPIWDGVEKFEGGSTVEINDWDWTVSPGQRSLINVYATITDNDNGYKFGNIILNTSGISDGWTIVGGPVSINVTENDFTINNSSNSYVGATSNKDLGVSAIFGGDLIITDGDFYFGTSYSTDPFDQDIRIIGNVIINSNDDFEVHHTFNGTPTITAGDSPVIIEGNLEIGSTVNTVSSDVTTKEVLFSGDNSHTIEVAPNCSNVPFVIEGGDTGILLNENLKFTGDSSIEVENGATFNFSFNGATALEVQDISGARNKFTQSDGATLFITHPQGIWDSSTQGNVEDFAAGNTTYGQTATFHYVGRENQVTGDALTTASRGRLVYVNLLNNNITLNLTNNIGISNNTTLDASGGKLEIQQGTVIGANNADFSGSGRLVMSDGEYIISTITTNQLSDYLPQLSSYSNYSLTGGTVHLNGSGADNTQILSGVPNYVNLSFSGSNILEGLPPLPPGLPTYKGISSAAGVSNNITISEDAIVDIKNLSLGGSGTNLIMEDQSRFIMAGSGTKPDATGSYTFSPNTTIEFNNNGGLEEIRLSNPVPDYANIVVSGSNVGTVALGTGPNSYIQFQANGSFTVTGTGTFKQSNSNGFSGLTNTSISNTNNPLITLLDNSTIEYQGANQNITSFTPEYKNVTISGTGIKTLGHATDILVGEDLNMVASTLNINTNEAITVDDGVIVTAGDLNLEDSGSLVQINDTDTNSGPITMKRNTNIRKLDYVYWSSPVDGYSINDVYAANTPLNRIYKWNPTITNPSGGQGNWVDASGETMQRGAGYIVRGPDSYTTTSQNITATFNNGRPFNGLFNVDVSRGSDTTGEDDDWNLIGNPYPSAINALDFLSNTVNSAVLDGFVNIWTHGNLPSNVVVDPFYDNFGSNYTANDYITHNGTGTTSGPAGFGGRIAAGQSFMVNMLDGNTATQQIEFRNNMRDKAHDNSQFYRNSQDEEKHRIWLDLAAENESTTRILVGYAENATQERDRLYDAITDNQNFYSLINDENFVIQGRQLPFNDDDIIPLGINLASQNNYTIAIAAIDGLFETDNQTIYLKDNLLEFTHNLSELPYTFTSESGEFNERFEIVFNSSSLSIDENELNNALTIIELQDGRVTFSVSNNLDIKNVKIYDTLGRLLYNLNGNSSTEVYNLNNLSQAAYLAKVTLSNDMVITKKAIKRN